LPIFKEKYSVPILVGPHHRNITPPQFRPSLRGFTCSVQQPGTPPARRSAVLAWTTVRSWMSGRILNGQGTPGHRKPGTSGRKLAAKCDPGAEDKVRDPGQVRKSEEMHVFEGEKLAYYLYEGMEVPPYLLNEYGANDASEIKHCLGGGKGFGDIVQGVNRVGAARRGNDTIFNLD
jgi:hypothetical protein